MPVDFSRDDLDAALTSVGHRPTVPTVWIWEGVVPYLTRGQVAATTRVVAGRSTPGSRLIVHYHTPTLSALLGRLAARVLTIVSRRPDPLAREPNRSAWTPAAMRRMLAAHGFTVRRDDDLLTLARWLAVPVRHRQPLRNGHVVVADLLVADPDMVWRHLARSAHTDRSARHPDPPVTRSTYST